VEWQQAALLTITQLLTDVNSDPAKQFASNLSQIPDNAGLAKLGIGALGTFDRYNALEPVAQRSRALARGAEAILTNRPSGSLSDTDLEHLRDGLMGSGESYTSTRLGDFIGRVRGGGVVTAKEAANMVRGRLNDLEHPEVHLSGAGDGDPGASYERAPTKEESEQAAILRQMLEQLQQSNAKIGETNAKLDSINMKDGGMMVGSG